MPRKNKPLSKAEIKVIEKWIQAGAIIDATKGSDVKDKPEIEVFEKSPLKNDFQDWTNSTGKVIEAKFLGLQGEHVRLLLKSNRQIYTVPLQSLSKESISTAKSLVERN